MRHRADDPLSAFLRARADVVSRTSIIPVALMPPNCWHGVRGSTSVAGI